MANNEKDSQSSDSFFEELGAFMIPYRLNYAVSVVLSIISVAANLGAYYFAGKIAASFFMGIATLDALTGSLAAIVICKLLGAILVNVSTQISHKAAYETLRDIRNAVSSKLLRLPMGYFEQRGTGRLKTLLVDRIESMEKTLAHMLPELTANLLTPLLCIIWMFFADWRLALISLIWIVLGFSASAGMMKDYDEKFSGQISVFKKMNQAIIEYVEGIKVIKNFGQADTCYEKYQNSIYDHAAYNVNWQKQSQKYSSLAMAIAPFSVLPVLIAGLFFFAQGTLQVDTFVLIVLLTLGIFTPLMNASNYFDQLASIGTDSKEIRDVLEFPELVRGEKTQVDSYDIEYDHVGFSYEQNGKQVLSDITLSIPQSTMLALVGPSGSGKSTIAKLLAGFWDPSSGVIKIGNTSISQLSQQTLNSLIAFVDQDTFLFDESIADNIRLACPDASDEQIEQAARLAGCDEFISKLPAGYHTRAGEGGNKLSGGEKQRISIVRAILKNAPIMILDEATSSTDPENEAAIQQALTVATKDKTLIVVAHRLATVMHANQIAYVEDGKIKALGTHEQLLENCPEYKNMWDLAQEDNHA